mmetsp:Transcript_2952/g.4977  ORF Transcript_2952/g.4977 Transcript_2952/m.4977 type:complete len:144 (+) Transcript_2952:55-486(+)
MLAAQRRWAGPTEAESVCSLASRAAASQVQHLQKLRENASLQARSAAQHASKLCQALPATEVAGRLQETSVNARKHVEEIRCNLEQHHAASQQELLVSLPDRSQLPSVGCTDTEPTTILEVANDFGMTSDDEPDDAWVIIPEA